MGKIRSVLIYEIKHNNVLKKVYTFIGSTALRFLGIFIRTDENLVLFVGNIGKSFSGSPYEIYHYMQGNDKYRKYKCIWAFNNPEDFKKYRLNTVKFDTLAYFASALKAKYWITDVNAERSLKFKKKETKYLNTWHGVALKKIGNDDKSSGRYDYSNIDYLCVSGEHDKRVYTSALNAKPSCLLECGMPRNDRLFFTTESERTELRKKLNIPEGKKVILYAPTWRDSVNAGVSYDLNIPVDFKKWEKLLAYDYVLFIRAHDRTTKLMKIDFNSFVKDYSRYEPLDDLLIVTDVLITDYSSIVFDYSILEKPFICFGYDFEQYCRERGTYFDPEKVYPNGVLKTEEEVLDALAHINWKKECENTRILKKKFMEYSHGKATETCVKSLFGEGK